MYHIAVVENRNFFFYRFKPPKNLKKKTPKQKNNVNEMAMFQRKKS